MKNANPSDFIDPMNATLRESRMVLERLVQWKGVEPGMIFSVMDCGLYSAALGLSGFEGLESQLESLTLEPHGEIAIADHAGAINVDAGGRHAWLVAEPILDILIDDFLCNGTRSLTVCGVIEPAELGVVAAIAEKHNLAAEAEALESGKARLTIQPRDPSKRTILDRIRRHGIPVARELWFHLLHLSSNALAEDTPISRTHTGIFMIKPDGTLVGEHDAELDPEDLSMLTAERLEFRR